MRKIVLKEMKIHMPFTFFGALTGLMVLVVSRKMPVQTSYDIFYILHPMHVVLSALATASMYELHTCGRIGRNCITVKCNFWVLLIIGYLGSVGIATLSDSLIPYMGEVILDMPNRELHLGFIEKWWLINPLAIVGVLIAYFKPATKFPHAGHVLLSTWASLFHIIMAIGGGSIHWFIYVTIFLFLFFAVWIPCCLSDIVFPLLFVKEQKNKESIKQLRI